MRSNCDGIVLFVRVSIVLYVCQPMALHAIFRATPAFLRQSHFLSITLYPSPADPRVRIRSTTLLPYRRYSQRIMASDAQKSDTSATAPKSTQSTQYDQIGTRYNSMHDLPAVRPERPSVVKALGDLTGKRCLGACHFWFNGV